MQRGIEIGILFSSFLIAHCLFVIHNHDRSGSVYPFMDLFFELALLSRVVCSIPRPYIWISTWRKFVHARAQPTPQQVSQALIHIYDTQNRVEKFLLYFYYSWLGITSFIALVSPFRTQFGAAVWRHLLYNFACIILHRIICIAIFYYLVNSDMPRGLHQSVLDSETTVVHFFLTEPQQHRSSATNECSICYADYSENDEIRILKCGHDYHRSCIDQWLMRHRNSCPMCLHVVGTG